MVVEESSAWPNKPPELKNVPPTQETNSTTTTAETIQQVTPEKEEELVKIPRKQYEELVNVNDSVYISLLAAYDKFDEIIGNIMNLNTIVFNKKQELKRLVDELNQTQKTIDSQR